MSALPIKVSEYLYCGTFILTKVNHLKQLDLISAKFKFLFRLDLISGRLDRFGRFDCREKPEYLIDFMSQYSNSWRLANDINFNGYVMFGKCNTLSHSIFCRVIYWPITYDTLIPNNNDNANYCRYWICLSSTSRSVINWNIRFHFSRIIE